MDSKTASVGRAPRNNRPNAPEWPQRGSGSEATLLKNARRKRAKLRRKEEEKEFENKVASHKAGLAERITPNPNKPKNNSPPNNRQNKRKRRQSDDVGGQKSRPEESDEDSGADDKDAVVKRLANERKKGPVPTTPDQAAVAVKRSASNASVNSKSSSANDRTIYTPKSAKQKNVANKPNGATKTETKEETKVVEGNSNGLTKKQSDEVNELAALQEVSSSTHFQRYFAVSTVFTGHLEDSRAMFNSADGDISYWKYTSGGIRKPEDRQVCACCTEEGHIGAKCPKLKCTHCSAFNDHFSSSCPKKSESTKEDSPADIWRTLPNYQKKLVRPVKCIPVSCYLCAGDDHLGDDCKRWSAPIEGAFSVKFLKDNGVLDKSWDYKQNGSHKLLKDDPLPEGGNLPDYLANMDSELGSQPHEEFNPRSSNNSRNGGGGGGGGGGRGGYNRNQDRSYDRGNRGSGGRDSGDFRKPWRREESRSSRGGYQRR